MPTSEQQVRVRYIISTRNRPEFLDPTLQNVWEVITAEDELIVIDGTSTESTSEIVKNHADIVTLFRSEPDSGEGHGYNKALFLAKGRYIESITDDDCVYPDSMRQSILTMETHPNIDAILYGGELWRIENGQALFVRNQFLPLEVPASPRNRVPVRILVTDKEQFSSRFKKIRNGQE